MRLESIKIKGFRNLATLELVFNPDISVHAFVGDNGQGKTNFLEAIYLCALSKSFRTSKNSDLISFDADFCSVRAKMKEMDLGVVITREPNQKALKVNGVKKKAIDFVGQLKAVFFSPDDLAHMSFAPKLRRRYLDVLLSQLYPEYLEKLMGYEEARKQRNALLKVASEGRAQADELDFWNEKLASSGWPILKIRRELIESIGPLIRTYYESISQSDAVVGINYQSSMDKVHSIQQYLSELNRTMNWDLKSGRTQLGPHQDDLRFELSSKDMSHFASRGEWRSLVLALKFAEIDLLKQKTGEYPILLLDDVFSELDETRQKYLTQAVRNAQTFVTTTHPEFVNILEANKMAYTVQKGHVSTSIENGSLI